MGGLVFFYFLKWVESANGGNGGEHWVDQYVDSFVNIGTPFLGVAKSISALISGEMKDTAELGDMVDRLRRRLVFDYEDILDLMRSCGSIPSMFPKGGDTIWGDFFEAADDVVQDDELMDVPTSYTSASEIGRAVQQECRDRSRMPSSA
eukprot:TRINITY_DN31013_c0_g1_i1.p1 TRINITY_DN31013_c0_g1~~TRINITY_DN31013_c0_g1_i1.p1  ORF type:complete len:149 (-),score=22.57 TRINITY_DN31013_c0_g1_i1:10-456(-)